MNRSKKAKPAKSVKKQLPAKKLINKELYDELMCIKQEGEQSTKTLMTNVPVDEARKEIQLNGYLLNALVKLNKKTYLLNTMIKNNTQIVVDTFLETELDLNLMENIDGVTKAPALINALSINLDHIVASLECQEKVIIEAL